LQYGFKCSSYGKSCNSELVQAVDSFITPTPLRNPHPTGSAKGCRGTARDILVVARVGHNTCRICVYIYYTFVVVPTVSVETWIMCEYVYCIVILVYGDTKKINHDQTEERNKNKTWTSFMYYSPKIRTITNLFKHTNVGIAFKNTNSLQQLTKLKSNNKTPEHDKSGIYKLTCNSYHRSYIGQTRTV